MRVIGNNAIMQFDLLDSSPTSEGLEAQAVVRKATDRPPTRGKGCARKRGRTSCLACVHFGKSECVWPLRLRADGNSPVGPALVRLML